MYGVSFVRLLFISEGSVSIVQQSKNQRVLLPTSCTQDFDSESDVLSSWEGSLHAVHLRIILRNREISRYNQCNYKIPKYNSQLVMTLNLASVSNTFWSHERFNFTMTHAPILYYIILLYIAFNTIYSAIYSL